jgi:N-formylglutamate deformylase
MGTDSIQKYSLQNIEQRLKNNDLPFFGITKLGSAEFKFLKPAFYAGTAIHAGNRIRDALRNAVAVDPADQYREEDPGTEKFIQDFPIQIIALDSRFEYDLNRPSDQAVYLTPDMSWGLTVWNRPLIEEEIDISLAKHREFHQLMDLIADFLIQQNGHAFIFDVHSYCYQREEQLPWYVDDKPVINLGTEAINQNIFGESIKKLINHLSQISVDGRPIAVAENEVFKGGYLARRLCARNHDQLAVFAIEFKKIFMDEWSGEFHPAIFNNLLAKFSLAVSKLIKDL